MMGEVYPVGSIDSKKKIKIGFGEIPFLIRILVSFMTLSPSLTGLFLGEH